MLAEKENMRKTSINEDRDLLMKSTRLFKLFVILWVSIYLSQGNYNYLYTSILI